MTVDALVVGAGVAGCVVAERLAAAGWSVVVAERRDHVGGNTYDYLDEAGLRVHRYGPHVFHTNSTRVFRYLSGFTAWRPYVHRVLASIDGQLVPLPVSARTVNALFGTTIASADQVAFLRRIAEPRSPCRTAEDVVLSRFGREIYERLFRNYTRKQWGLDPSELDASITARIPIGCGDDDAYFTDRYQAMPVAGYTALFERMLDRPRIEVRLATTYRDLPRSVAYRQLIWTGPIDEYFDYRYGPLPYRSLRFVHRTIDRPRYQPIAVVNFPNEHAYTRVTEYKHLTGQVHARTSIAFEYPAPAGDPFYPVLHESSRRRHARYRALAARTPDVHFIGRLGSFRYFNIDQVVGQALTLASRLVGQGQTGDVPSR